MPAARSFVAPVIASVIAPMIAPMIALCLWSMPVARADDAPPATDAAAAHAQARAHFARRARVALKRVEPASLEHRNDVFLALETGDLFPFAVESGLRKARGFASADGRVVLAKARPTWTHLFAAARILDPAASLDAPGVARRLVWLGDQGDLVLQAAPAFDAIAAPGGDPWPTITRDADGVAITYTVRPPGRRTRPHPRTVTLRLGPDGALKGP